MALPGKRKPGDRTFEDAFIITLLTDLSQSPDKKKTYFGYTPRQLLAAYNYYLFLIDIKSAGVAITPGGTIFDRVLQRLRETFNSLQNLAFNIVLGSVDDDIKAEQILHSNKNYGTDPTHTQIAKDDVNHPLNDLAGAGEAVRDITMQMYKIWESGEDASGKGLAEYVVDNYTLHPLSKNWEEKIVVDWADRNKNLALKLSRPLPYEYTQKKVQRVIDNSIIKKLIR